MFGRLFHHINFVFWSNATQHSRAEALQKCLIMIGKNLDVYTFHRMSSQFSGGKLCFILSDRHGKFVNILEIQFFWIFHCAWLFALHSDNNLFRSIITEMPRSLSRLSNYTSETVLRHKISTIASRTRVSDNFVDFYCLLALLSFSLSRLNKCARFGNERRQCPPKMSVCVCDKNSKTNRKTFSQRSPIVTLSPYSN